MRPTKDEIAGLLARFDQSNWDEMDLKIGDFRLRLSNDAIATSAPVTTTRAPVAPAAAKPVISAGAKTNAVPEGHHAVRAQSLGRFWRKPKPTEPAFVEIGQEVKAGDVVCIIEVMKLFTQVKSEVAGKITSCPLTDGEMVEFDDVLFVIQPTGG